MEKAEKINQIDDKLNSYRVGFKEFDLLCTGVGMVATSYHLGRVLASHKYDRVINAGIAGSFDKDIPLGSVVEIVQDQFPKMGAEDGANFLLNYAYPELQNKKEILFSDVESAVKTKEVSAGLIIHENRFTYAERGFEKVKDLGEHWEQNTGMPIPLGGIAIKRKLEPELQEKVQRLIKKSLEFAFENPSDSLAFVKEYAQEMDEVVMQKHIHLYVNHYSLSLGEKGKAAIQHMCDFMVKNKLIKPSNIPLFV